MCQETRAVKWTSSFHISLYESQMISTRLSSPWCSRQVKLLRTSMKTNHLVDDARRFTEHLTLAPHQDPVSARFNKRTDISGGSQTKFYIRSVYGTAGALWYEWKEKQTYIKPGESYLIVYYGRLCRRCLERQVNPTIERNSRKRRRNYVSLSESCFLCSKDL